MKVYKTFRTRPGRHLNDLRKFNLRPMSTKEVLILVKLQTLTCNVNKMLNPWTLLFKQVFAEREKQSNSDHG